jgi:hypothetical protein
LLNNLLKSDPDLRSLPEEEQAALFASWIQKGDVNDLQARFAKNPAWQRSGWRAVAEYSAAQNDFEAASKIAFKGLSKPVLPKLAITDTIQKLQRRLLLNPADYPAAYALYEAEIKKGRKDEVLAMLQDVTLLPGCPPYFYFLEADLHAGRREWQECWTALKAYGDALRKPGNRAAQDSTGPLSGSF